MKKIFSVLLCLVLVLTVFSACAKSAAGPRFVIEGSASNVVPGGEVTLTYRLEKGENVACFDLLIPYDPDVLTLADYEVGSIDDFFFQEGQTERGFVLYGYTAATADIDENDIILTLTFQIDENCPLPKVNIPLEVSTFLVGTDDSGDDTVQIPDEIYTYTIPVKGA